MVEVKGLIIPGVTTTLRVLLMATLRSLILPIAIAAALVAIMLAPSSAAALPVDLDVQFGTGGITSVALGKDVGYRGKSELLRKADGKYVAAMTIIHGPDSVVLLMQFTATGDLDPTFGDGDGKVETGLSHVEALAPYNHGVLVAGAIGHDPAVKAFTATGVVDDAWAVNGLYTFPNPGPSTSTYFTDATWTSDQKLLVHGWGFGVSRLLADGTPDATFSGGVTYMSDARLLPLPDGSVRVLDRWAVTQLSVEGEVDGSWGDGGVVPLEPAVITYANDAVIDSEGAMLIGGSMVDGSDHHPVLLRMLSDGTIDPGFALGDTLLGLPESGSISSVRLQADGKVLVAGMTGAEEAEAFFVKRLTAGGLPDPSFSLQGLLTSPMPLRMPNVFMQTDGRFTVGGIIADPDPKFGLRRYRGDSADGIASLGSSTGGIASPGEVVTFSAVDRNRGPRWTVDGNMLISVPRSYDVLSVRPSAGSCSVRLLQAGVSRRYIHCEFGRIKPLATRSVAIKVRLPTTRSATVVSSKVGASSPDARRANNVASRLIGIS